MSIERPHAIFHLWDNLVWTSQCNHRPWKLKSRTLTIWMKIGRRRYLVNMHMYEKKGASRCSRLFTVHTVNCTFCDGRTHVQMYERTNIRPADKHRSYFIGTMQKNIIKCSRQFAARRLSINLSVCLCVTFINICRIKNKNKNDV